MSKQQFLTVEFLQDHCGWRTGQKASLALWYANSLIERGIARKASAVDTVQERMDRYFRGEPVPELEGKPAITYGDAKRLKLVE